ncbi:proteasome regulatory particle base subunit [Borealophlyctis nickersoniae]|nr:proteasome regulatory particle base subunit [Borealophlyctis nickersoniae]
MNSPRQPPGPLLLAFAVVLSLIFCVQHAWGQPALNALNAVSITIPEDFVNLNLHRVLNLASPGIVREETTVVVGGTRKDGSGEQHYYLGFKEEVADASLAFLEVKEKKGGQLEVTKSKLDGKKSIQYYKVELAKPLKEGDEVTVVITATYTHLVKAFPKEIPQLGKQMLEFRDNVYFFSPYKSEKQKTTLKISSEIVSLREEPHPVTRSQGAIVYGPYTDVAPLSYAQLYVHYVNSKAILVAKTLHRKMEISHWGGQLAVQEDYELHHNGAKLKGQFSRTDFTVTQRMHDHTNVVKLLTVTLPPKAHNPFFRDIIGNVSTSRFRNERSRSVLELRPRYPLYGGWKYTWHHGYHVPLDGFLKKNQKAGQYVLRVPFIGGLPDVTIEKAIVSIALPEGATNIKVSTPFSLDKLTNTTTYTYLDTLGHPTVILEKRNVVDEYAVPITITYDYSSVSLLQKPLAVSVAILLLFALSALYTRLDLAIIKDPKVEIAAKLDVHRRVVQQVAVEEKRLLGKLVAAFDTFRSTKEVENYKEILLQVENAVKSGWAKLSETARSADVTDASYAERVRKLQQLKSERLNKMKTIQSEIVQFLTVDAKDGIERSKKKAIMESMDKHEVEMKQLDAQIDALAKSVGR